MNISRSWQDLHFLSINTKSINVEWSRFALIVVSLEICVLEYIISPIFQKFLWIFQKFCNLQIFFSLKNFNGELSLRLKWFLAQVLMSMTTWSVHMSVWSKFILGCSYLILWDINVKLTPWGFSHESQVISVIALWVKKLHCM